MSKAEQLRVTGQLPSPKGVALAIMEICRREDATLDEVARVVQADPALSSRLLRQANSAAQGGRAISSVRDVVLRLGMSGVCQLAMGFSFIDQYASGPCRVSTAWSRRPRRVPSRILAWPARPCCWWRTNPPAA